MEHLEQGSHLPVPKLERRYQLSSRATETEIMPLPRVGGTRGAGSSTSITATPSHFGFACSGQAHAQDEAHSINLAFSVNSVEIDLSQDMRRFQLQLPALQPSLFMDAKPSFKEVIENIDNT